MRPDRTWIVIADGAHMSVVQCEPGDPQLIDVDDMHLCAELPRTRELVTDRPGRSFESHGRTRHAKEGRSDPHRELKRSFAKSIANRLGQTRREALSAPDPDCTASHPGGPSIRPASTGAGSSQGRIAPRSCKVAAPPTAAPLAGRHARKDPNFSSIGFRLPASAFVQALIDRSTST